MIRPSLRIVLSLGLFPTIAVLSGCSSSSNPTSGEASKSANQIFADAQRATESVSSVHVFGRVTSGTDKIGVDIVDSTVRGGGTISQNGSTFQVVLSGRTIYLKTSAATMSKAAGSKVAGQLLGDKWLQTTTDNKDFGSLAGIFNLSNLIHNIKPQGAIHKGSVTNIDGQSVIVLTDSIHKGTLYVADTGPPYMIELVGGSGEAGTIRFNQYGAARPPAIPTGAINLDQLGTNSG